MLRTEMALLLVAALMGGLVTFAALLPYGILTALVGASLGGSVSTLLAGLLLAYLRDKTERRAEPALDVPSSAHRAHTSTANHDPARHAGSH